jgi:hypothetical protein
MLDAISNACSWARYWPSGTARASDQPAAPAIANKQHAFAHEPGSAGRPSDVRRDAWHVGRQAASALDTNTQPSDIVRYRLANTATTRTDRSTVTHCENCWLLDQVCNHCQTECSKACTTYDYRNEHHRPNNIWQHTRRHARVTPRSIAACIHASSHACDATPLRCNIIDQSASRHRTRRARPQLGSIQTCPIWPSCACDRPCRFCA